MVPLSSFENPFSVTTPEDMSASDAKSLFVDVFTDFPKVRDPGHAFLHGPRGSGKSMMFRYLKPDCQRLANECSLRDLAFFAVYLPIKSTYLRLAEFQRLEGKHADMVINEHFMTIHFAEMILSTFSELTIAEEPENVEAVKDLFSNHFLRLLRFCGWKGFCTELPETASCNDWFREMRRISGEVYGSIISYLKRLSFSSDLIPYGDALCGYPDFLLPLLCEISKLPFMPSGPIYLLIDDADDLSETQTKILNSWVSTRTMAKVSLKIATRNRYKTYYTTTGTTIDTPHDYAEVNISTVYTSSIKGKYMSRVREIVRKRLENFNIKSEPEDFFPEDEQQEKKIKEIATQIKLRWENGEGRGNRANDDVTRYARPDYIKSLAGISKSSSSYSYAGFEQLVHLSSGIVRYFLDAASQMYNETKSRSSTGTVDFIPSGIQSSVIRKDADRFLFDEIEKIAKDKSPEAPEETLIRKLSNLINALGGLFRTILTSDRSERRVFSIAFSDTPTDEIIEVLRLGVRFGYFHESTIGKKDGITGGRTKLYILSRRLAPFFNLDPTSFAGYQFVTSRFIEAAIERPEAVLRRMAKRGIEQEVGQTLPLFEESQI